MDSLKFEFAENYLLDALFPGQEQRITCMTDQPYIREEKPSKFRSFVKPATLEMIRQPQEKLKKFVAVTLSNKKRKQLKSRLVKVFKLIALVVEMNNSNIDGHSCQIMCVYQLLNSKLGR